MLSALCFNLDQSKVLLSGNNIIGFSTKHFLFSYPEGYAFWKQ